MFVGINSVLNNFFFVIWNKLESGIKEYLIIKKFILVWT